MLRGIPSEFTPAWGQINEDKQIEETPNDESTDIPVFIQVKTDYMVWYI
jgi:hypothetical protein